MKVLHLNCKNSIFEKCYGLIMNAKDKPTVTFKMIFAYLDKGNAKDLTIQDTSERPDLLDFKQLVISNKF